MEDMKRSGFVLSSLCATAVLCFSLTGKAEQSPFANVSKGVFADLLKIPLAPPAVNASVHGTKEEEGLVVEDVSWPALDNDRVPAFIVRPAKVNGQLPAIICLHGSSTNREVNIAPKFGFAEWTRYGTERKITTLFGWARELSRHGYVTLSITQRGLDSREPSTEARNKEALVHGRNVMGEIIQEIRQAISYLEQRQDVDPKKIGMTGMSFGGITTFYTWLVDDRIAAAAPICGGIGSVKTFLEKGARGYHGIYWWVPGMLIRGDQGDFAAAQAPRPLMLWAPLDDIGMPREGVDEFLKAAEPAYRQAGATGNLVVHRQPGQHEFTMEAFTAMKAFFDRQLRQAVIGYGKAHP